MSQLENEFKSRFPSMKHMYEQLSLAMHEARPDASLFETARVNLIDHFDARRLYRLPAELNRS